MTISNTERMKKKFAGKMLAVEEMEEIVGGAMSGMNQDAALFKQMGYDNIPVIGGTEQWKKVWASFGVDAAKTQDGGSAYSVNGKPITQGEAWKMVKEAKSGMNIQGFTIPVGRR